MNRNIFPLGIDENGCSWIVQISKHDYDRGVRFAAAYNTSQSEIIDEERADVNLYIETNERVKFTIKVCESEENCGVGTLLLTFVEKYALKKGIKELCGDISEVYRDHFDKLKHFYEKNKYKWELFQQPTEIPEIIVGRVSKSL